ncbi:LysR substrate-binding domain-containing protein [Gryllotalpicola reticulitermitis]|uniref:LysR substrate-binding domain-containing protein n=1 Tax=Gryllotalpicola reticulitermitis TaxID=1184153 RepID=A0ABV8Q3V4_9MICO
MPGRLRISYPRGVTPGKWARIWGERFPRTPLELALGTAVTDVDAQLAAVRNGEAALVFLRLPMSDAGEPAWPRGARPEDVHFIALYDELPFAVAAKGNVIEAASEITVADLDGEVRHPFDDDIAMTVEIVAANVGVVVVPQSIARLYARKDVVARPVTDAPGWRVGIAWPRACDEPRVDDFVGIVRGRTANSSRGVGGSGADGQAAGNTTDKRGGRGKGSTAGPRSGDGGERPQRPAGGRPARPSRAGRRGRRSTR